MMKNTNIIMMKYNKHIVFGGNMENKLIPKKEEMVINVFFDEKGISINELLESDFSEFLNNYIKTRVTIY